MRVLQSFYYALGSKPSFDKLPGMIDEYLRDQNLSHRFFHYRLENFDSSERYRAVLDGSKCRTCPSPVCGACMKEAEDGLRKGTACERAAKEYPFLGPVRVREENSFTIQSLHNFSDGSEGAKTDICRILPHLSRRYGFTEISLIYRDIDFFSRRFPTSISEKNYHGDGRMGSGITLLRGGFPKGNAVILTVESRYPGEVPSARPYANALGQHLACEEYLPEVNVILDEVEEARYEDLSRQAQPLLTEAKALFDSRIPLQTYADTPAASVRLGDRLKKCSAQYGYDYQGYSYYVYTLEKKLHGGHKICLEFVSEPRFPSADPMISLCGLGFRHKIWNGRFRPHNPRDAKEYLASFFEILAEAEKTIFPAILDLYPPTPNFFLPSH